MKLDFLRFWETFENFWLSALLAEKISVTMIPSWDKGFVTY